jgi:hypothetical protein
MAPCRPRPEAVTGFELVFTGSLIQANATANAAFTIATTENATGAKPSVTLTNTVASTVTAPTDRESDRRRHADGHRPVGLRHDRQDGAPGCPVAPGDSVIASLHTVASATGDGAHINDIVVEDAWNGAQDAFWNAFSFTSVAPTQVPANTTLTVQVRRHDGTWVTLATAPAQAQAFVFQMDAAATAAALAPLAPPTWKASVSPSTATRGSPIPPTSRRTSSSTPAPIVARAARRLPAPTSPRPTRTPRSRASPVRATAARR